MVDDTGDTGDPGEPSPDPEAYSSMETLPLQAGSVVIQNFNDPRIQGMHHLYEDEFLVEYWCGESERAVELPGTPYIVGLMGGRPSSDSAMFIYDQESALCHTYQLSSSFEAVGLVVGHWEHEFESDPDVVLGMMVAYHLSCDFPEESGYEGQICLVGGGQVPTKGVMVELSEYLDHPTAESGEGTRSDEDTPYHQVLAAVQIVGDHTAPTSDEQAVLDILQEHIAPNVARFEPTLSVGFEGEVLLFPAEPVGEDGALVAFPDLESRHGAEAYGRAPDVFPLEVYPAEVPPPLPAAGPAGHGGAQGQR